MLDWVISVLERAQQDHLTGRLHIDFRHGRVQHIERSAMPAPPNTGAVKDVPDVLAAWLKCARTGHVDIYLFQGTLVEVVESEVLFPPREDRCPRCGGTLSVVEDYGNIRVCNNGDWRGSSKDLRDEQRRRSSVTNEKES